MTANEIVIRPEEAQDLAAIHSVNERAFGSPAEADLVDMLRRNGKAVLSLVATAEDSVVGHILFSIVTIDPDPEGRFRAVGLAPMAVLPERQNRGIGSMLVRDGLSKCRDAGFEAVVVLGHSHYYPRFGFVPASRFGLTSEYDVPDDVFMALELRPGSLKSVRNGIVRYQPEFAAV
ncbi:MAG TPA: N-acetyltransferase [Blastocatellia bacterium]|nr:N-acetyltransferase [Blastocatellia bacterium]